MAFLDCAYTSRCNRVLTSLATPHQAVPLFMWIFQRQEILEWLHFLPPWGPSCSRIETISTGPALCRQIYHCAPDHLIYQCLALLCYFIQPSGVIVVQLVFLKIYGCDLRDPHSLRKMCWSHAYRLWETHQCSQINCLNSYSFLSTFSEDKKYTKILSLWTSWCS